MLTSVRLATLRCGVIIVPSYCMDMIHVTQAMGTKTTSTTISVIDDTEAAQDQFLQHICIIIITLSCDHKR